MARLYEDFIDGTLSASATNVATSLSSAEFANLPVVSGSDTLKLVLDPQGRENGPEVVTVTAHTSAATTVTVTRGEDGTTAVAHSAGAGVVLGFLASDIAALPTIANDTLWDAAGDVVYATGADAATRLALGTAGQVLTVNAGATAPEWASASGGVILEGSNTVEQSTASTTAVDLVTISGLSIPASKPVHIVASFRAGSGSGSITLGLKVNSTIVGEAGAAVPNITVNANQNGHVEWFLPPRETNYPGRGTYRGSGSGNAYFHEGNVTANIPVATITSIAIRAYTVSSTTGYVKNVLVYSLPDGS